MKNLKTSKEKELFIENLKALKAWVSNWIKTIKLPHIVLLYGAVGSGKTQFVQFLVESLQEGKKGKNLEKEREQKKQKEERKEEAFSPSFTIHNHYKIANVDVEHFDFYRLESERELENIGFWDFFYDTQKIIVIEWVKWVDEKCLPSNWNRTKIEIKMLEEEKRYLFIQ